MFLMVRRLKYGTVARFFRKCTKNIDETLPEPSGTLRAKYGIYWWRKHQFCDVFLHIYEKRRQFYDVCWHIGKNLVNFTTCFDTFPKNMSILRRVFEGQNAEVRYCCTIFSKKYEKRRRDARGRFRATRGIHPPNPFTIVMSEPPVPRGTFKKKISNLTKFDQMWWFLINILLVIVLPGNLLR